MTYLEGWLEITRSSREHEVEKKQFCLERDIPLFGYGSTTFRKEEKERGLEPEECYSRGQDKETPDVAREVVKTHGSLDKLDVYRGLGVREVWVFEAGAFRVLTATRASFVRSSNALLDAAVEDRASGCVSAGPSRAFGAVIGARAGVACRLQGSLEGLEVAS